MWSGFVELWTDENLIQPQSKAAIDLPLLKVHVYGVMETGPNMPGFKTLKDHVSSFMKKMGDDDLGDADLDNQDPEHHGKIFYNDFVKKFNLNWNNPTSLFIPIFYPYNEALLVTQWVKYYGRVYLHLDFTHSMGKY